MSTNQGLYSKYKKYAWKNFIPLNATIELTVKCNFKCLHCYNLERSLPIPKEILKGELELSEIFKVIEGLYELGSINLTLTGGEPLVHPHIFTIIEYAKTFGFLIRIKTNGLRLSLDMCKKLKDAGVNDIDISIYGNSEVIYKQFTQTKNAYEKTIEGVKNAIAVGFTPSANIVIHKLNYKQLPELIETLGSYGASVRYSDEITKRYDNDDSSQEVELSEEDYYYINNNPKLKDYFYYESKEFSPQCSCARTNIAITSRGDIYPCIGAPLTTGNVREDNLVEVWKNSEKFKRIRNLEEKDFKACTDCQVKKHCLRSSGAIYANTKNYTGCDPQTLKVSSMRALSKT